MVFKTAIRGNKHGGICGPLRRPRQMLAEQDYIGHDSVHDDMTARRIGFDAGTIEGPTHFSQLEPLAFHILGEDWFSKGCLSLHYVSPCYDGDEVQACAASDATSDLVPIELTKADGDVVLEGEISLSTHKCSYLERRLQQRAPAQNSSILSRIDIGHRIERHPVKMGFETPNGPMYPFSLRQKLSTITEPSPWFEPGANTLWGRSILPFEMISVLMQASYADRYFPVDNSPIALFADQEIRLFDGPVFPDENYEIDREVVALTQTRRSECLWVRSQLYREGEAKPIAAMLLNTAHINPEKAT